MQNYEKQSFKKIEMEISKKIMNVSQHPGNLPGGNGPHYSVRLLAKARADTDKTWLVRRSGE